MEEHTSKCLFCEDKPSKYSCPRCLAHYCSIKCYQHEKHSQCSETFYKDQVISELKEMKGTDEEKEKIMNILKKLKKQDDSIKEADEKLDISERLADINLDNSDAVWEKLTPKEQELFQRYVSKGNLNFVPTWTPWWCNEKRSPVVELPRKKDACRISLPKILKDLPQLTDLLRDKIPDPNLKFCLMDVLLAYLCTQRVFNGDMYDAPTESLTVISNLSRVLYENSVYSDLDTCLHSFVNNVSSSLDIDPIGVCLQDLQDVVISNNHFVQRALSDFYKYLKSCRKHFKEKNAELSQTFFKMAKKVYFYAVYYGDFKTDVMLLGHRIGEVQKQFLEDKEILKEQKEEIERHLSRLKPRGKNILIEEIS